MLVFRDIKRKIPMMWDIKSGSFIRIWRFTSVTYDEQTWSLGVLNLLIPSYFFLYKERHPNVSAEHLAISPNGDNERYVITTLTSLVLTMCTKGRLPIGRQHFSWVHEILDYNQQNINAVISTNLKHYLLLFIGVSRLIGYP